MSYTIGHRIHTQGGPKGRIWVRIISVEDDDDLSDHPFRVTTPEGENSGVDPATGEWLYSDEYGLVLMETITSRQPFSTAPKDRKVIAWDQWGNLFHISYLPDHDGVDRSLWQEHRWDQTGEPIHSVNFTTWAEIPE